MKFQTLFSFNNSERIVHFETFFSNNPLTKSHQASCMFLSFIKCHHRHHYQNSILFITFFILFPSGLSSSLSIPLSNDSYSIMFFHLICQRQQLHVVDNIKLIPLIITTLTDVLIFYFLFVFFKMNNQPVTLNIQPSR